MLVIRKPKAVKADSTGWGAMIRLSMYAAASQAAEQQSDELRADGNMLAAVGITQRMYRHATTRPLGNYFVGVVGDTQLYRKSSANLGLLTGIYASSAKPDFRQLDRNIVTDAFTLRPGTTLLSEEETGEPVASVDLLGTPAAEVAPAQPRISVKMKSPEGGEGKKEKKAKKEKGEKKEKKDDKKRKRSPSAS